MGVDNKLQIENTKMCDDPRLHKIFIKPLFLDALQARNANQESVRDKALRVISASKVICVFGTSIGYTDKYWWKKIGEWLKNSSVYLVIFDVCGASDDGVSPLAFLNSEMSIEERKNTIIERFLLLSELDLDWLQKNSDRLIIELDTKMFDFKLPRVL